MLLVLTGAGVVLLPGPLSWTAGPVDWPRVAVLAGLHACWESFAQGVPSPFRRAGRLVRVRLGGTEPLAEPESAPAPGSFLPVLFAGVLMLPPGAAALVALPAVLTGAEPRRLRRAFNAAQFALAAWAGAVLFERLDGPRLLLGCSYPDALLPALAAVLAFCLVNGALVTGIRLLTERRADRSGRAAIALPGPAALLHALGGLLMAVLWQGPYGGFAAVLALLPLSVSAWVLAQGQREWSAHRATVEALVQAVEIKDAYTRGHSERVGRASVLIAGQLGIAGERLRTLHFAGTLHDVGKLGVATELLRRNGPLSDAERRAVEVHPEYGHELVRGIDFLGEAHEAILHHHERMDGRGYPHGLAGERIPEFARIIAVADAFDSMTSTRSYRRGRPVPEAVAELRRCAGSQFDPVMVDALVAAVERHGWQPVLPGADQPDAAVPDIPLGVPEPAPRVSAGGGR